MGNSQCQGKITVKTSFSSEQLVCYDDFCINLLVIQGART